MCSSAEERSVSQNRNSIGKERERERTTLEGAKQVKLVSHLLFYKKKVFYFFFILRVKMNYLFHMWTWIIVFLGKPYAHQTHDSLDCTVHLKLLNLPECQTKILQQRIEDRQRGGIIWPSKIFERISPNVWSLQRLKGNLGARDLESELDQK